MNKILRLSSWFAIAGVAWGVGYFYNARYGGEVSWLRIMYEQKMAIASEVQAPRRILIVGGSGAHYTVDAKQMQQETGIPTINLATDGPVGMDLIFQTVSDAIRPGDIVLLIPEYLLLTDDDGFGDRSGQFSIAIGRPGLGGMPAKQLAQDFMLVGIPTLRALTKSGLDLVEKGKLTGYYSDPVDSNGSPTVTKARVGKWWQLEIDTPITPYAIERITAFRDQVEAKGATLVLGLSWIYAKNEGATVENVRGAAAALEEIAPLLYDRASLNIKTDPTVFADTHYHLLPEGRRIRTTELVQQLRGAIDLPTP